MNIWPERSVWSHRRARGEGATHLHGFHQEGRTWTRTDHLSPRSHPPGSCLGLAHAPALCFCLNLSLSLSLYPFSLINPLLPLLASYSPGSGRPSPLCAFPFLPSILSFLRREPAALICDPLPCWWRLDTLAAAVAFHQEQRPRWSPDCSFVSASRCSGSGGHPQGCLAEPSARRSDWMARTAPPWLPLLRAAGGGTGEAQRLQGLEGSRETPGLWRGLSSSVISRCLGGSQEP